MSGNNDSDAKNFGEEPFWQEYWSHASDVGWTAHGGNPEGGLGAINYISKNDPAWGEVLEKARHDYGDPNIHYNTDNTHEDRYLVFNDGTPLPRDGTVVYHDSDSKKNWQQNTDGTVTPLDENFNPITENTKPFKPYGYLKGPGDDAKYAPVDAAGRQVAPLQDHLPDDINFHTDPKTGIKTPLSDNGSYYTIDPDDPHHLHYFDRDGNELTETEYLKQGGDQPGHPADSQGPADEQKPGERRVPGENHNLESKPVVWPEGLTALDYPDWATETDPDVSNQMSEVVARLYKLFGEGNPETSDLPEFPFTTDDGSDSGIDTYDNELKAGFKDIETKFHAAAKAYKEAVDASAIRTVAARNAIDNAIQDFNNTAGTLDEGNWDGLLGAESTLLDTVKSTVEKAAASAEDMPDNPPVPEGPPPPSPFDPGATSPVDPAALAGTPAEPGKDLSDLLSNLGNPLGAMPANPLGANPLGAMGNPLGNMGGPGGPSPLTPLSDAVKPLSKLADKDDPDKDKKKVTPLEPAGKTPLTPPPAPTPAGPDGTQEGEPEGGPEAAKPAGLAGESDKPTVTLPDGTVVEADSPDAAKAAQNALDNASPGGDPAQKAYADTDTTLPSDGKNLGARVDPADVQPGDVLKWKDKTLVVAGPGLVADATEPGVTHTLAEVLEDQKGFEGIFRPTAVDPTLSAPTPPPLPDVTPPAPPSPPGDTSSGQADAIPLAADPADPPAARTSPPPPESDLPGDAAPPSPFEAPTPPPATRSTRAERIAAGME